MKYFETGGVWLTWVSRRGTIRGISVHIKRDVLFFLNVCIQKGYEECWSKGWCTKGGSRVKRNNLTIDVLVSSNSQFHPLLSYGNSSQRLPYPFLLGFAYGLWVFTNWRLTKRSWAPLSFLFGLRLSYCAIFFVWLMQLVSYMLWMKKCSMTFLLEGKSGFYMW